MFGMTCVQADDIKEAIDKLLRGDVVKFKEHDYYVDLDDKGRYIVTDKEGRVGRGETFDDALDYIDNMNRDLTEKEQNILRALKLMGIEEFVYEYTGCGECCLQFNNDASDYMAINDGSFDWMNDEETYYVSDYIKD